MRFSCGSAAHWRSAVPKNASTWRAKAENHTAALTQAVAVARRPSRDYLAERPRNNRTTAAAVAERAMQFEGCGHAVLSENLASRDTVDQLVAELNAPGVTREYSQVLRGPNVGQEPTSYRISEATSLIGSQSRSGGTPGNGGYQFVQRQRLTPAHLNGTCLLKMTGIWHRLRR